MHYYQFGQWHGFMWIYMLIFWVLVVLGIIYLVNRISGTKNKTTQDPMDILKSRYAKGELTDDQFEKMKKKLEDNSV